MAEKRSKSLLACEKPDIPLFSEEYLSKLAVLASSESKSILKLYLLWFITWFNYSVLNELVEKSSDKNAAKLLNEFKSYIDFSLPLQSFPLPVLSQLIIPNNDSFTCVATKYNRQIHRLQDIVNIQDLLVVSWKITKTAIQFVAVKDEFVYWMIPTCIKEHVEKAIGNISVKSEMWDKGVTTSTILPTNILSDNSMTSDELSTKGPFSFLNPNKVVCTCVAIN